MSKLQDIFIKYQVPQKYFYDRLGMNQSLFQKKLSDRHSHKFSEKEIKKLMKELVKYNSEMTEDLSKVLVTND